MEKLHFSQKCINTIKLHKLKQLFMFFNCFILQNYVKIIKILHFCWFCVIKVVSNNDLDMCGVAKMVSAKSWLVITGGTYRFPYPHYHYVINYLIQDKSFRNFNTDI